MIYTHDLEKIKKLPDDYIFVFGSNKAGRHGAGAAKTAINNFGAVYGEWFGHFGQSYAIPTLDENLQQIFLYDIYKYYIDFINYAHNNKNYKFVLTKIGCGLARYKNIDQWFKRLNTTYHDIIGLPENIIYPTCFVNNTCKQQNISNDLKLIINQLN